MKTIDEIRVDLRNIRFYYSNRKYFLGAAKIIGENVIVSTVNEYATAMKFAPPQLYSLYSQLYVDGGTQYSVAFRLSYSEGYIQKQNSKLLNYLYDYFNGKT